MQPSPLVLHRRLDELVLEALAAHQQQNPVVGPSDSHVSIEVVLDEDEDDDTDEVAVTHRFVRISSPYEAVEIAPIHSLAALRQVRTRATTFARTVNATKTAPMDVPTAPLASETLSFDKAWFEQPDDAIAAIEDAPVEAVRSWWWLGLSLFVAAAAVSFFAVY